MSRGKSPPIREGKSLSTCAHFLPTLLKVTVLCRDSENSSWGTGPPSLSTAFDVIFLEQHKGKTVYASTQVITESNKMNLILDTFNDRYNNHGASVEVRGTGF